MSDIARVFASGKEPWYMAGTTAANAAGVGLVAANGKELADNANDDLAHSYGDIDI